MLLLKRWIFLSLCFMGAASIHAAMPLELQRLHQEYAETLSLEDDAEIQNQLRIIAQQYQAYLENTEAPSGLLHYNLGTIFLKIEDYGKSIYHLKHARILEPNDLRIVDHLRRASKQAGVDIFDSSDKTFQTWIQGLWQQTPVIAWQSALVGTSILFLCIIFMQKKGHKTWITMTLCIVFISALATARQGGWGTINEAVLISPYNPKSGLGEAYPSILLSSQLQSGHCGRILRQHSGWAEVDFYGTGTGWVPSQFIRTVEP